MKENRIRSRSQRIVRWLIGGVACLAVTSAAQAVPSVHAGIDPGVGPADPRPQSNQAASNFLTAAGVLGPVTTINLEGVSLGNFSGGSIPLGGGLSASASVDAGASINAGFNDSINGFPTSPPQFIWMSAIGTANRNLTFSFGTPVQAFGTFIMGLGTAGGSTVNIDFNDGTAQNYMLTGSPLGGAQYWGFVSPGASVSSVSFTQDNGGDAFAVDDISFVTVPEPSGILLASFALLALLRRNRRID